MSLDKISLENSSLGNTERENIELSRMKSR